MNSALLKENEQENLENLPGYMRDIYYWAYVHPVHVPLLDRPLVVNTILWGNMNRLAKAAREEMQPGQKVLQIASVYGTMIPKAVKYIGEKGRYDILDVTPIQVKRWEKKLQKFPQAGIKLADAEDPIKGEYDIILNFFLLHEVPDAKKRRIVNNMLKNVKPGGKAVFVDYHEPVKWHPLKFFMRCLNRVLEPFAEALWDKEISEFADDADKFNWEKKTYFGGLYQKVVATPK